MALYDTLRHSTTLYDTLRPTTTLYDPLRHYTLRFLHAEMIAGLVNVEEAPSKVLEGPQSLEGP